MEKIVGSSKEIRIKSAKEAFSDRVVYLEMLNEKYMSVMMEFLREHFVSHPLVEESPGVYLIEFNEDAVSKFRELRFRFAGVIWIDLKELLRRFFNKAEVESGSEFRYVVNEMKGGGSQLFYLIPEHVEE